MRTFRLLAASVLLGACATTPDGIRLGEPTIVAAFPYDSEAASDCLARAWQSVRVRGIDGPLRVTSWVVAGRGTVKVELPKVDGVVWYMEVARDGEATRATAWSRRTAPIDLEPTFAEVMRQAVRACRGEVVDDRLERTSRRRIARAG